VTHLICLLARCSSPCALRFRFPSVSAPFSARARVACPSLLRRLAHPAPRRYKSILTTGGLCSLAGWLAGWLAANLTQVLVWPERDELQLSFGACSVAGRPEPPADSSCRKGEGEGDGCGGGRYQILPEYGPLVQVRNRIASFCDAI
jgi:hypothetical protein